MNRLDNRREPWYVLQRPQSGSLQGTIINYAGQLIQFLYSTFSFAVDVPSGMGSGMPFSSQS
ncbi:MAG: hypothetical protein P8K11_09560 [Gammaproteobacteria bacterium]|nr:hypothetical protein [Gammaproteobacteria bacterium]